MVAYCYIWVRKTMTRWGKKKDKPQIGFTWSEEQVLFRTNRCDCCSAFRFEIHVSMLSEKENSTALCFFSRFFSCNCKTRETTLIDLAGNCDGQRVCSSINLNKSNANKFREQISNDTATTTFLYPRDSFSTFKLIYVITYISCVSFLTQSMYEKKSNLPNVCLFFSCIVRERVLLCRARFFFLFFGIIVNFENRDPIR